MRAIISKLFCVNPVWTMHLGALCLWARGRARNGSWRGGKPAQPDHVLYAGFSLHLAYAMAHPPDAATWLQAGVGALCLPSLQAPQCRSRAASCHSLPSPTGSCPRAPRHAGLQAATPEGRSLAGSGRSATPVHKPDWRPPTKYEQRGRRLGHRVSDLVYRRTELGESA